MDNTSIKSEISKKLDEYFDQNIRLTFVTESNLIIITKDDKFYNFKNDYQTFTLLTLEEGNSSIESMIEKELSYKGINNISIGNSHVFAWNDQQKIYCWGQNRFGQLGNGEQTEDFYFNKPQLNKYLSDKNIVDIKCGLEHSLAITESGDLYAWGWNRSGQIGNQSKFELVPYKLNGFNGEKVIGISCGPWNSMALTESGLVYSWGYSMNGCLGLGKTKSNIFEPRMIEVVDENIFFKKISCGQSHSLLLSREGDIYAFGSNQFGQIGNGSQDNQWIPLKININSNIFIDIATHNQFDISIAVSDNNIHYIWGKCGEKLIIKSPKETQYNSVNDIFNDLLGITYNPSCEKLSLNKSIVKNGLYEEFYEEIEKIGFGSYGSIFKVKDKSSKRISAVKKIEFKTDDKNEFLKEFQISSGIKELNSEYVIHFTQSWFENYKNGLLLYIDMELCDETLEGMINRIKEDSDLLKNETLTPLGYYIANELFIEILEGVNYLHKQNPPLIHRDLKPDNIFLRNKNSGKFIKIADFGLMTYHEFAEKSHDSDKGTAKFMAPEVIDSKEYDTKADIYSLGAIMLNLFRLFNFERTYNENESSLLIHKYQKVFDLCQELMNSSPQERPNCQEVIERKDSWILRAQDLDFVDMKIYLKNKNSFLSKILESKLLDSIGAKNLLTKVYDFSITNSTLLSLCKLDYRIQSMYDLSNEKVIDINNEYASMMALTDTGKVFCWNTHRYNKSDDGSINNNFRFELNEFLSEKNVTQIKSGPYHSLVLTKSGEVYAWGRYIKTNLVQNIGDQLSPNITNGFDGKKVVMISCGSQHSMALTECGHVYSWGNNQYGQLGVISRNYKFLEYEDYRIGSYGYERTPQRVRIPGVLIKKISCGSTHSILLSCDGDIYVCGNNYFSQLGNLFLPDTIDRIPFKIESKIKFVDIGSHCYHNFSVALSENGVYYVWGQFQNSEIDIPKATDFKSFDEIYAKCFETNKNKIL